MNLSIAIVSPETAVELIFAACVLVAAIAGPTLRNYVRARRRSTRPPVQQEIRDLDDAWSSLPPKWSPTRGDVHLGKTTLGERRATR